jgi:hypothetical protein
VDARNVAEAVGFGGKPAAPPAIVARNWKAIGKNTLVGSADVIIVKWHLVFKSVCWHRKGDREWIGLPAREWTDRDGKRQFADVIGFINHGTARGFREAALAAIREFAGKDGR